MNEQLIYGEFQIKENKLYEIIKGSPEGEIKHSDLLNRSNMNKQEFQLYIDTLLEKEKITMQIKKTATRSAVYYSINESK